MKWNEMTIDERDSLVAEKIMHWEPPTTAPFTTDLNAAWLIMDKIKPGRAGLGQDTLQDNEAFMIRARLVNTLSNTFNWYTRTREHLCETICKAALEATGVEIQQ